MRTLLLIVIVLGVALIILGLYLMIRARLAQAREQQRVERGDPEIIEGQARVVDKTEPGQASGNASRTDDHARDRPDTS